MNNVFITFIPCSPEPANGYRVTWRVRGSSDPYTDAGLFTESPAMFIDLINPTGTCYEGFIQSECESGMGAGQQVPWLTDNCEESGTSGYAIALTFPCGGGYTSSYLVTGGTAGDTITVRAQFSGVIQRIVQEPTRADLAIWSEHGTSDSTTSQCHKSLDPHNFSITVDTVITMADSDELIGLQAICYNSSVINTAVIVSIISINGSPPPTPIFVNGCRGQVLAHVSC